MLKNPPCARPLRVAIYLLAARAAPHGGGRGGHLENRISREDTGQSAPVSHRRQRRHHLPETMRESSRVGTLFRSGRRCERWIRRDFGVSRNRAGSRAPTREATGRMAGSILDGEFDPGSG